MCVLPTACVFPPPPLEEEAAPPSALVDVQKLTPRTAGVQKTACEPEAPHLLFDVSRALVVPAGGPRSQVYWWVAYDPENPFPSNVAATESYEFDPCDEGLINLVPCDGTADQCVKTYLVEAFVTTGEMILAGDSFLEQRQSRNGEPVTVVTWTVSVAGDPSRCSGGR